MAPHEVAADGRDKWNRTVRRESLVPGGFVLYNKINRKLGDNEYKPCLVAEIGPSPKNKFIVKQSLEC